GGLTGLLALLAQSVEHLHGKEGVDGSSPSEGSAKTPETGAFARSRSDRLAPGRACGGYGAVYGAFAFAAHRLRSMRCACVPPPTFARARSTPSRSGIR